MKREFVFDKFECAVTSTESGKTAFVYQNTSPGKAYYRLMVEGRTIFTRGTMRKVCETLEQM